MPAAYLKAPETLPSTQIQFWCWGKERFESAVLAWTAANRRRDRPRQHYLCKSCGGFHVGTVGGASVRDAAGLGLIR